MLRLDLDLRASLRLFRRNPGLSAIAIAALAMGIGFTTTMFSIVRGGTRPLPFDDPDQLLIVTRSHARLGAPDVGARAFDFHQWSALQTGFTRLAAFTSMSLNLSGEGERPERIPGAAVTPGTFALVGVSPVLGRDLRADEAGPAAPAVAVISWALWQRRFDADPDVLSRALRINGEPHTIVGVMPPGFGFPVNAEAWVPLRLDAAAGPGAGPDLRVFGRLRPNVSMARASVEMETIARRLADRYAETHGELGIRAFPFAETEMPRTLARVLYLMLGAVSFVLLIACANVANLLLARAATRTRDVAIRTALGASRRRIIGQQLAESLALSAIGALIGLGIAVIAVRFFDVMTAGIIEAFWMEFRVDASVVLFATALTALAAIAAGVVPAARASGAGVGELLKDRAHGTSSLRMGRISRALVIGEIALSCGLLIMTTILVQTAVRLRTTPLPFDPHAILTAEVGVTPATATDRDARNQLYSDLLRELDAVSGLNATALTNALPGRGAGKWSFALDDEGHDAGTGMPITNVAAITPGFFEVLGARVQAGRDLTWLDDADAPGAAIANESFVRRFSADTDILGRRVRLGTTSYTIVGVVADLQMQDVDDERSDGLYIPLMQSGPASARIVADARGDPLGPAQAVVTAVAATDADLPVYELLTLHDAIFQDKRVLDAMGTLFFLFGIGAVFLTVIGLYGVVSFGVTQRTREIGVRRALGARPAAILALVLRGGALSITTGIAIGLLLAWALSRAFVAGVEVAEPAGPLTFALVAGTLMVTALLALVVPARRALAVEPNRALRME
ncbi:MAG: ADOP family duplicated permease [Gemmatimonadetes bacterium]|nr:ADOP family duplicated permease [Gemmatimonadota bacterium]